jgi:hypothetical protein
MPKHHKRKSQAIAIGKTTHSQGGVGFISPKLAEAPCVVTKKPSVIAELLEGLPTQPEVTPPN